MYLEQMKRIIILIAFLLPCIEMHAQTLDSIAKIEFTSLTRGYNEQIIITKDSITVESPDRATGDNRIYARKIEQDEWKTLLDKIKNVPLHTITALKSPTKNRSFDGARHSSIRIMFKNEKAVGHAFDDDNPNSLLQPLMATVRKVAERTVVK